MTPEERQAQYEEAKEQLILRLYLYVWPFVEWYRQVRRLFR